ncbi:MAG TPA: twin-arginine translocation signal domain-containing protein, partial [Casimicrobiaceae bacterium]|nr:twin-arginine translocation signal domain-containing protein [Casimicrobiaceae bacterium]
MSSVSRRDFLQALAASSGAVLLPGEVFAQGSPKPGGTLVM